MFKGIHNVFEKVNWSIVMSAKYIYLESIFSYIFNQQQTEFILINCSGCHQVHISKVALIFSPRFKNPKKM